MTPGEPLAHRPALQGWPELGGLRPAPPQIDAAQAAFRRGVEAHARGAHAQARAEFLQAEALIPKNVRGPYAASLDELRRIARANAAITGSVGGLRPQ